MKKKRWTWICTALVAVGLLAGLEWSRRCSPECEARTEIQSYGEALEAYARACLADPSRAAEPPEGWSVAVWPRRGQVEFLRTADGFGPFTRYQGVIYSTADVPLGFQGTELDFVPDGDGWVWQEAGGDNRMETRRLAPRWFWFEMTF